MKRTLKGTLTDLGILAAIGALAYGGVAFVREGLETRAVNTAAKDAFARCMTGLEQNGTDAEKEDIRIHFGEASNAMFSPLSNMTDKTITSADVRTRRVVEGGPRGGFNQKFTFEPGEISPSISASHCANQAVKSHRPKGRPA